MHWCPSPNMDCPYLLSPPNIWVFCAEARNERRRRTVSLSERRGRHVTHSFLSRAPHPHRSSGGSKNPHSLSIHHPPHPTFSSRSDFYSGSMMRHARPTAISSREGPPTRRELALARSPHLRSGSTACFRPLAVEHYPYYFQVHSSTSHNDRLLSLSPYNTLCARWQPTWESSAPTPLT